MFDSFASRTFQSGLTAMENNGDAGGANDLGRFFGGVSAYQPCACCARFHGATDAGDGSLNAYLNADDRGVFGDNGKPSLTPGDAGAQITRTGASWAFGLGQPAVVTYSFRDTAPSTMPSTTSDFSRFTSQQIAAAELAFAAWSDVANITFTRVNEAGSQYSNNATIVLGNYGAGQGGSAAFAYLPGNASIGSNSGDVWVNTSLSYNANPVMQGYGQQVLLHEIGHAIGLSHPAAYNAAEGVSIVYGVDAIYFEDSRQYTVMSYFSESNTGAYFGNRYASAPLLDDIAAAQRLYGANMSTRTGDTVYGFNSNAGRAWYSATSATSALIFSVWDAGGVDTFDFSGYSQNSIIDLRQGAFSNVGGLIGNVSIGMGVTIENVIGGTGADQIRGNSADNIITGNGGNDTIDGGLGSDTVVFAGVRSAYTISWNGQVGTVSGPGGTVKVRNVEFLKFSDQTVAAAPTGGLLVSGDATNDTMNGTAFADTMGGLGGHDTLNGLGGDDLLDGGSGNDTLNGGDGNDILIGGLGDDVLNGGAGFDVADYSGAQEGVTVDLATGLASGGAGHDTLSNIEAVTGTAFNDTLRGDAADNILRGGGGIDTLHGGDGADQLYAGAPGQAGGAPDVIKGQATANATIASAVSLTGAFDLMTQKDIADSSTIPHATVRAVAHGGLEYYAVTVQAGDKVLFDIDNATFDSTLRLFDANGVELAQNDDSASDGGSDTDSGLTYTFATAGTYYIQVADWAANGGGTFTSKPPVPGARYTLHVSVPSAPAVPLILEGSTLNGDAGADRLEGGVGRDTLNGGDDNDVLIGGGGDDQMDGGAGMDTAVFSGARADYVISTSGLITTITGPDGVDRVTNVERLQFSNGLFDINGNPLSAPITGTSGNDVLVGTAGDDTINGEGGDDTITGSGGNDAIDGGTGEDTAVFSGPRSAYTVTMNPAGVTTVTGPDGVDTLRNVERLQFSDGVYDRQGNPLANTINGTSGADTLVGTSGVDAINGLDGDDIITGAGGDDRIDGGAGQDTAVFSGPRSAYVISTTGATTTVTGPDGGDTLVNIERLRFADGLYDLQGDPLVNTINGTAGADALVGTSGVDVINGLDGDDVITGGAGNDTIDGGAGFDVAVFGGSFSDYSVHTEGGVTTVTGPDGTDTLTHVERLRFADATLIVGAGGGQYFEGGSSGDTFNGTAFNDLMVGGAGNDVLNGGGGDDVLIGGTGDDTLNGGAGHDVADYSGAAGGVYVRMDLDTTINDGSGGRDTLTGIEQIVGSGFDDVIFGGSGNDVLLGGAGHDVILGLDGDDVIYGGADTGNELYGGLGDDIYVVENANDTIVEWEGEGVDTVLTALNRLRIAVNVENLTYIGTGDFEGQGNDGGNVLRGGAGRNVLLGFGGDDLIYAGSGSNELYGGLGDDRYVVTLFDTIIEGAGEGVDTAVSLSNYYVLGANLENLEFGGTGNFEGGGNGLNNHITGGVGRDRLSGEAGDDVLNGGGGDDILIGGTGDDTLNGGAGHDVADYSGAAAGVYVRMDLDTTINDGSGGRDTLIDIEEILGSAFDDVIFGGSGGDVLRGGAGHDVILGLDGDDVIYGGADTGNELYGGLGDDIYVVENANDTIVEWEGEGVDTVLTSLNRLRIAVNVENLTYTGTGDFEGQGNDGGNVLRGGAGRNVLLGFGGDDIIYAGSGSNELYGGTGDDRYVATRFDTIIEGVGEGVDTVVSLSNYYVLGVNLENLEFGGTGNFDGSGNASNNRITGGAGDDVLRGGGGDDIIDGGLGRDEVHLRGAQGDYTITAEGGGYRVVDSVGGRDGSTLVTGVEVLRFLTGNTVSELAPPSAAGVGVKAEGPQVSPLLDDDAFVLPDLHTSKAIDFGPQILPGVHDNGEWSKGFGLAHHGLAGLFDNPLVVAGPHGPLLLLEDAVLHPVPDQLWG